MPAPAPSPRRQTAGFDFLEIFKVGTPLRAGASMLPVGVEASADPLKVSPVQPSVALENSVVAASGAGELTRLSLLRMPAASAHFASALGEVGDLLLLGSESLNARCRCRMRRRRRRSSQRTSRASSTSLPSTWCGRHG